MARVHHVKRARKAHRGYGIRKGQEYWWASYRVGRSSIKRVWDHPPRPSEVTRSEFLSAIYGHQETLEDTAGNAVTVEDVHSLGQDMEAAAAEIEQLADEQEEKYGNMPDGLQQGDTGQLLERRADQARTIASELEDAGSTLQDFTFDPEEDAEATEEEACRAAVEEAIGNLSWDAE